MDPRRSGGLERQREVARIIGTGLRAGGALDEPYRSAACHVDGGQQREGHVTRTVDADLDPAWWARGDLNPHEVSLTGT